MSRKRDLLPTLALAPSPAKNLHYLDRLQYAQPTSVQLRDGDVIVFRRVDSPLLWSPSYFQEAAAERQFPLFASILSNGKRHTKSKAKGWKALPSALTSPP